MTFPAYPEYKDSGVEWLGEVPSHWEHRRLKWAVQLLTQKLNSGAPAVALENIESWSGRFLESDAEYQGQGTSFERGDILFGKLRPYLAKVALAEQEGEAVGDFHVFRPSKDVDGRFLQLQMLTRWFISVVDGSTFGAKMPRASWDFMSQLEIAVPPVWEQKAIAAFLDRETGKIDALVAEQEKLIELLKEKRQAVISHAVTKGLDPNVPMKDSGVEWLGEVPEHWEVVRLKTVLEAIQQGWSPEAIDRLAEDGEWGVLKAGCVNNGRFRDTEHKALPEGVEPPQGIDVRPGDVLMSRASGSLDLIGSVALVEKCDYKLIMSDKVFRLKPLSERVRAEFLALLMGSRSVRAQVRLAVSGAEGLANNISKGSIREMWIALPPVPEQAQVTSCVGAHCYRLDQLAGEAQRAIDLLKERRSALISAAVTGKIDVRGLVDTSLAPEALEPA